MRPKWWAMARAEREADRLVVELRRRPFTGGRLQQGRGERRHAGVAEDVGEVDGQARTGEPEVQEPTGVERPQHVIGELIRRHGVGDDRHHVDAALLAFGGRQRHPTPAAEPPPLRAAEQSMLGVASGGVEQDVADRVGGRELERADDGATGEVRHVDVVDGESSRHGAQIHPWRGSAGREAARGSRAGGLMATRVSHMKRTDSI